MVKEDRLPVKDNDVKLISNSNGGYKGGSDDLLNESIFFNGNSLDHSIDTLPVKLNGSHPGYSDEGLCPSVGIEEYSLKRLLDVLVSSFGMFFCLPFSIIIALAIRLEDGGPIFYSSRRVGKDGAMFKTYKFRTMIPDSDLRFGPLQAVQNDTRITRIGRILRATAMDEIPQLWNVLKGDMSIVGPRALLPAEIEVRKRLSSLPEATPLELIPGFGQRHSTKPGLTGLAQIYAPRDVTRKQKFRYDIIYLKRQNLRMDVQFIALSLWITLRAKWESRGKKI